MFENVASTNAGGRPSQFSALETSAVKGMPDDALTQHLSRWQRDHGLEVEAFAPEFFSSSENVKWEGPSFLFLPLTKNLQNEVNCVVPALLCHAMFNIHGLSRR